MCKHFIVLYGIFTQTYVYYVIFEILAYCKIASANTGCEFCIETFLFNNFCIFINFHILINCYTIQLRKICVCLFSQKPELWKEATLRATITCTTKIVFALHALKMSLMFECVCVCVYARECEQFSGDKWQKSCFWAVRGVWVIVCWFEVRGVWVI